MITPLSSAQTDSPRSFSQILSDAVQDAFKQRGKMNLLIAGRSGVGKSTLLNAIFQHDLAETGAGQPVTREIKQYSRDGFPLSIWDTRGLEMEDFETTMQELSEALKRLSSDPDPDKQPHVAWLCIHEDGRRVEDAEIKLHELLAKYLPVIVVITKARSDQGFSKIVQQKLPKARNVVRVRALEDVFEEGIRLPPMGLDDLMEVTYQLLPEARRMAFTAALCAGIKLKKSEARKVVAAAAAAAGAAGATPIPFSDAFILAPIQVGMLAKISAVFGLDVSSGFLSTLVASAAGVTGATLVGRTVVSGLLKMIPGAGSIAGGAIAATTAATITTALGNAYIEALAYLQEESQGQPLVDERIAEELRSRLKLG